MKLRLHGRYVLIILSLLVAIVVVNSGIYFFVSEKQTEQLKVRLTADTSERLQSQLEKKAIGIADYLVEALFNPLYYHNPEEAYYVIQAALSLDEVMSVYVVDERGNIFHDGTENLLAFGRKYQNKEGVFQVIEQAMPYTKIKGERFVLGRPVIAGNELVGGLFMEFSLADIYQDIQQMEDEIQALHREKYDQTLLSSVLLTGFLVIVGGACSVLIARSLTRPLRQLIAQTERIGDGDFSTFSSIDRQDEIGDLANAFNRMGLKLKQHTDEIYHQAHHDSLTGLPNRARFIEYLELLINQSDVTAFTVLFVDLDEFKCINDNYGHKVGDLLLCELASRMKESLGVENIVLPFFEENSPKPVVARIGGDEFLICLPDISTPDEIDSIVDGFFEVVRSPVAVGSDEVVVGGSVGIATYPHAGYSADELIKNADIAMYDAKASGKNTYSYFRLQMNEQIEIRADIERELRKSLALPEHFELWFQPQFRLTDKCLVGAEALVRWRHPERGLIAPDAFIPIAEETGLIIPIGDMLIENLCQQLKGWLPAISHDFYVAINLSAKQVYRHDLANVFSKRLHEYQIPARHVHVEITESFLMRDEQAAQAMLKELRKLGIQVWLDDFGTGFSSLSYLRHFQVDGLKIDRSFVADIESDQQDRALTSAIISMARQLHIPVVAEGIETFAQADFLQAEQCDFGQGFLFSEPRSAASFKSLYILDKQRA